MSIKKFLDFLKRSVHIPRLYFLFTTGFIIANLIFLILGDYGGSQLFYFLLLLFTIIGAILLIFYPENEEKKWVYRAFVLGFIWVLIGGSVIVPLAQVILATEDSRNLERSDPFLFEAYSIIKIHNAWDLLNNLDPPPPLNVVKIGIIDSGVDLLNGRHPEFQGVSLSGLTASVFRDGDDEGHGTQVAGIIGANNTSFPNPNLYELPHMNGIVSGVHDLDYSLELGKKPILLLPLLPIPIFDLGVTVEALAERNVKIINMSFSSYGPVGSLIFEILEPVYLRIFAFNPDVLFVVAAGNFEFDFLGFDIEGINAELTTPGNFGDNFENVISVGATEIQFGSEDARATFSNFGDAVNIAAPGRAVYSPSPRGKGNFPSSTLDYDQFFSGTSAATPMVTGVAAILKALEPEYRKYTPDLEMTSEKIKEILVASADPVSTDELLGQRCFNQTTEKGCRLNSHRAVAWQFPPASSTPAFVTSTANTVSLSWNLNNFDFHNPDFDSYKLYRSTTQPVTQSSTLIQTITSTSTTTFLDSGLTPATTYFYKLFTFDKAGLSSESSEIPAATAGAPTIPDIRGLYIGTAISSQTNCQNPADNITVSWPNATINISSQSNGNFNATGTIAAVVNSDVFLDNFVIAGSVSESGNLSGTVANTFFINDIFNSSGQGTFTGQFLNDILNLSFSTQDIVGDTCSVQGTLTAARQ